MKARAAQGAIRTRGEAGAWVKQTWGVAYASWGMRWVVARLTLTKKAPQPRAVQSAGSAIYFSGIESRFRGRRSRVRCSPLEEAQQAWKKRFRDAVQATALSGLAGLV